MDELLSKTLNELTEEEWKQVQQFKNKKKPSINFSKATYDHCVRPDGLALNLDYINVKAPSLHIPDDFKTVSPSLWLSEALKKIDQVWVLDNEKACRLVIDAILTEVLLKNTDAALHRLWGFCKVKNDWEGTGFGYTGDVDYMLGYSKFQYVGTMDSSILVVQAKQEWPDSSIAQVLCEAGCLLKKRLAAGKNTPVFAALTNGLLFRFFAIDVDAIVYASPIVVLNVGDDGTYNSSASLSEILRWFNWFITSANSISSSEDFSVEDSLTQLRNCFGTKNRKKIKIQE
ncbi:hypothetical protein O9G_000751 [Rozella allomycis CSF55]|uniref:Uncharacterized protein n=1 Tax=Rozella allomycis (strain CSF55) TaxID=988480 RepID=A0A075AYF1_ROZAC|nr:hypothetical protein O9G_000751 [Rozella allomycis CSF55]|eukprot:EPZ35355.1 hypothetical protein O9G_000751 [Rozella allomycis CSF55]